MLRGLESRIESLVEGVFGRAFRSHVQPVELARKLVKEMDDHRTVSVSRVYVPNEYLLYLSPKDRDQFRGYERSLLEELAGYLAEHARREGYALVSSPRVLLEEDGDLSVGEFGIATRLTQQPRIVPDTPAPTGEPEPPLAERPLPVAPPADPGGTRVFESPELTEAAGPPPSPPPPPPPPRERFALALGSVRHELDRRVTVLGRSKECDVVVDDPSVSRRHAEVHQADDGIWFVDLGSTNGSEVNGKRVDRARLQPGDTILVGQTEFRYERVAG